MKTIAIIDDDIHIGDMLEEVLKREKYNVIRAYSGTEAVYMLNDNTPDLVLLDLILGYVFTYFYYPSFARRGCFKDPDFHKNALIFFLILFAFDMLIKV